MDKPVHIKDVMGDIMMELSKKVEKAKVLGCFGCGKSVLDTKDQNVYYGIEDMIDKGHTVCHECLSYCLQLCMDRPVIVRSKQGLPVAERLSCLPFSDKAWLVLY